VIGHLKVNDKTNEISMLHELTDNIVRLQGLHEWDGLKTVVKVDRKREFKNGKNKGKEAEIETSYYLSLRLLTAKEASEFIRGHWRIENSLHHVLDVS
jgi:predicted transposase YbfD/YdcC